MIGISGLHDIIPRHDRRNVVFVFVLLTLTALSIAKIGVRAAMSNAAFHAAMSTITRNALQCHQVGNYFVNCRGRE